MRLFSVRHEFPTEWAKFKSTKIAGDVAVAKLTLDLSAEHYPFWSRDQLKAVARAEVFARAGKSGCEISQMNGTGGSEPIGTLVKDVSLGDMFRSALTKLSLKQPNGGLTQVPTGKLELCFTDNSMDDLWLAVTWSS